jgi:hypothetical protein
MRNYVTVNDYMAMEPAGLGSGYRDFVETVAGKNKTARTWKERLNFLSDLDFNSLVADPDKSPEAIQGLAQTKEWLAQYSKHGYLRRAIREGRVSQDAVDSVLRRMEDYLSESGYGQPAARKAGSPESGIFKKYSRRAGAIAAGVAVAATGILFSLGLGGSRTATAEAAAKFSASPPAAAETMDSEVSGPEYAIADAGSRQPKYETETKAEAEVAQVEAGDDIEGLETAANETTAKDSLKAIYERNEEAGFEPLDEGSLASVPGDSTVPVEVDHVYADAGEETEELADLMLTTEQAEVAAGPEVFSESAASQDLHIIFGEFDDQPEAEMQYADWRNPDSQFSPETMLASLDGGTETIYRDFSYAVAAPGAQAGKTPAQKAVVPTKLGWENRPQNMFKRLDILEYKKDPNLTPGQNNARRLMHNAAVFYFLNDDSAAWDSYLAAMKLDPNVSDMVVDSGNGTDDSDPYRNDGVIDEHDMHLAELIQADMKGAGLKLREAKKLLAEGRRLNAWLCTYEALRLNAGDDVSNEVKSIRKGCGRILVALPYAVVGDPAGYWDKMFDDSETTFRGESINPTDDGENPTTLRGAVKYTGNSAAQTGTSFVGIFGNIVRAPVDLVKGRPGDSLKDLGGSVLSLYRTGAGIVRTAEGTLMTVEGVTIRPVCEYGGSVFGKKGFKAGHQVANFVQLPVNVAADTLLVFGDAEQEKLQTNYYLLLTEGGINALDTNRNGRVSWSEYAGSLPIVQAWANPKDADRTVTENIVEFGSEFLQMEWLLEGISHGCSKPERVGGGPAR